jgi:hypothetical protein
MLTQQRKLIALLEMARDAEGLQRYPQAEHLYKRAAVIARMAYGSESAAELAVLWDIARVCNKQNHKLEAAHYYNRACAVGFFKGRQSDEILVAA